MRVIGVILRKELLDIIRNRRRLIMVAIFSFVIMPRFFCKDKNVF